MPQREHRTTYPVVTLTVVSIALFGFMTRWAASRIPDAPENKLAEESGRFMRQASRQRIDWRPFGQAAFEEAKAQKRPILLVLGQSWCSLGRRIDQDIFSDVDIAALVNRSVIPIRGDLAILGSMRQAFLPFTRVEMGRDPGIQIYVLTADGRLVQELEFLRAQGGTNPNDAFSRLSALVTAAERADDPNNKFIPGASQREQVARLTQPAEFVAMPIDEFNASLQRGVNLRTGGFPVGGVTYLRPQVYRYLMATRRFQDANVLLNGVLQSSQIDWLDGGFFRVVAPGGAVPIEFDQSSTSNAEMMGAFAMAYGISGNPLYKRVAEKTFDALAYGFARQDGIPAAGRIGDEVAGGRSRRSSFPVRLLLEKFSADELNWLQQSFGLRVETNPSMAVRMPNPQILVAETEKVDSMLRRLRAIKRNLPVYDGRLKAEPAGHVVARMIHAASLLDDRDRLAQAKLLYRNIQAFVAGEDVVHTLIQEEAQLSTLGDYLAMADAALQHFLATGDPASFKLGTGVLRRATFLFRGTESPGVWPPTYRAPEPWMPIDTQVPELADQEMESDVARLIRLSNAYGRLLRMCPGHEAEALTLSQIADSAVRQSAMSAAQMGVLAAGFFTNSLSVMNDVHAIAVGPDAVDLALRLRRRFPIVLCAPAVGEVRPDLQARPRGIYIIRQGEPVGPLNLDDASTQLIDALQLN